MFTPIKNWSVLKEQKIDRFEILRFKGESFTTKITHLLDAVLNFVNWFTSIGLFRNSIRARRIAQNN